MLWLLRQRIGTTPRNTMKKIVVFVGILMLFLPILASAQLNSSEGRDYYVGLLYPSFMSQQLSPADSVLRGSYSASVMITSYYTNTVTLSYFDSLGNESFRQSFAIPARGSIEVPLELKYMKMSDSGEVAEYKACHIVAISSINVQMMSRGVCSGESYSSQGTSSLGKNYVVESYHDNPNGTGGVTTKENSAGYFMIVAAFDNTTIQIIPNTTTLKGKTGINSGTGASGIEKPFQISLNRGQCYMVKSSGNDIKNDISGTSILSSKPIAVIAGHENALTDKSDTTNTAIESRNFMVEQMLACEYWDSTGYISLPFAESPATPPIGIGDEYRIFTNNPLGDSVTVSTTDRKDILFTPQYPKRVATEFSITSPIEFRSINKGRKFHVVQYDNRMQSGGAPYSTPRQMSIIPTSQWGSSSLFTVPNLKNTSEQKHYLNIICRRVDYQLDTIRFIRNDGKFELLKNIGTLIKYWDSIPNNSELVGLTYSIEPGPYYLTSFSQYKNGDIFPSSFIVYSYGSGKLDPDGISGTSDDRYYSYASPVGLRTQLPLPTPVTISTTIDTFCSSWRVCIHVRGGRVNPGVRQLTIIDNSNTDVVRPAIQYRNVRFDPAIDSENTRQVDLSGKDSDYCVKILVSNPLDSGYCPLYIVDGDGYDILLELRYKPINALGVLTPASYTEGEGTIVFPNTSIGSQSHATYTYKNVGDSAKLDPTATIRYAGLRAASDYFSVTDVFPQVPVVFRSHSASRLNDESIRMTITFTAKDTLLHIDTLIILTDCITKKIALAGQGVANLNIQENTSNSAHQLSAILQEHTISLSSIDGLDGKLSVELYDLLGRKVFDWNSAEKYKIDDRLMLPMPSVATGAYLLRLHSGEWLSSCVVNIQ